MATTGNYYMTVGIGLLCNHAKNILLCADMRASYGSASSNDQTGKLFDLPRFFCGATAGTTSQCEDVISELYHRMGQLSGDDVAPEQVRQSIVDSYHRIYIELSDQALRSDPRITMEQYLQDQTLAQQVRQRAEEVLQDIEVDVDLVVAGFRGQSPIQFVAEGGKSISVRAEVSPGNAVIGSGSMAALNWLNYRKQSYALGLAHSLLHLTEAKQFAEIDPTVGPLRQMILLWPGGFKGLEGGDQLIEGWWHRYRLLLSDGLEDEAHNQAVRETFGIPSPA